MLVMSNGVVFFFGWYRCCIYGWDEVRCGRWMVLIWKSLQSQMERNSFVKSVIEKHYSRGIRRAEDVDFYPVYLCLPHEQDVGVFNMYISWWQTRVLDGQGCAAERKGRLQRLEFV